MDKWEYKVSTEPQWATQQELEDWLNELGAEGWDVMRIPEDGYGYWYFKRKVELRIELVMASSVGD